MLLMSPARRLQIPALLLLLASCSRDPSTDIEKSQTSLHSWGATLRLAVEQWRDYCVPALYLDQVLDSTSKALDQEQKEIARIPSTDARRAQLQQTLDDLRHRVADVRDAAVRHDSAAALRIVEPLPSTQPTESK
jgi:hypothetical protein